MTVRLIMVSEAMGMSARRGIFPPQDDDGDVLEFKASPRMPAPPYSEIHCGTGRSSRRTALHLGLTAVPSDSLRPTSYGRWSGQSIKVVGREDPEGLAAWSSRSDFAPPEGESFDDVVERTSAWMAERAASRGVILAVAPASVVRAAIVTALGAPASCGFRLDVAPLRRAEMTFEGRNWRLRGLGAG